MATDVSEFHLDAPAEPHPSVDDLRHENDFALFTLRSKYLRVTQLTRLLFWNHRNCSRSAGVQPFFLEVSRKTRGEAGRKIVREVG